MYPAQRNTAKLLVYARHARWLCSLLLAMLAGIAHASDAPSQPSAGVTFSQQTLGEGGSVDVEVWLADPTGTASLQVDLEIFAPEFVEWHDDGCSGKVLTQAGAQHSISVKLGALSASTTLNHQLCMKIKPKAEIEVGEFNILFLFRTEWEENKLARQSLLTVEKPLKTVLLGSDSIAGVPLSLAGFVVPGLFFWFAVSFWRAPWGVGLALGEKMFYSVVVSAVLVVCGSLITKSQLNVVRGVSLAKLTWLALLGIVVGTIVGGGDWLVRYLAKRSRLARIIKDDDSTIVVLEKLLNLHPVSGPSSATVRLHDGKEYQGSLTTQTPEKTILVGWFKFDLNNKPRELARTILKYEQNGTLADIMELLRYKGLTVEDRNAIKGPQVKGQTLMRWSNTEVATATKDPDKGEWPLLEIIHSADLSVGAGK